jgi:hypothetical protein
MGSVRVAQQQELNRKRRGTKLGTLIDIAEFWDTSTGTMASFSNLPKKRGKSPIGDALKEQKP